jgi:DNA polymerase V
MHHPIPLPTFNLTLPLLGNAIPGFHNSPHDHLESDLDLQGVLAPHKEKMFVFRAVGRSMEPMIHDGDLLIINRSIQAVNGCIVVANIAIGNEEREFTVKTLVKKDGFVCLRPLNPDFSPIVIQPGMELNVFGVVAFKIHAFSRQ